MDGKLYFLAFYKHSAPQHLVAGPFVDIDAAELAKRSHPLCDRLALVSCTMTFELEE